MRQRVHQGCSRIAPCTRRPLRRVDYRLGCTGSSPSSRCCSPSRPPRRPARPRSLLPRPSTAPTRALTTYVERLGPFTIGPYETLQKAVDGQAPAGRRARSSRWTRGSSTRAGKVIPQHDHDAAPPRLHQRRARTTGARDPCCPLKTTRERFWGTSEELRPLTLPPGYGYPTDPADQWRALADGHAPPRRRAQEFFVEYRVTVDPRPTIPVKPYWLSIDPVLARPAVDGARRRHAGRTAARASSRCPRRAGSSPSAATCTAARELDRAQPAALPATARWCATKPAYAPAGDPLYEVRPLLHEPDPKSISWWQSATGWPIPDGRAAQGHRGLRQHAPAHARDGDRARLRRAAAGRARRRRAARPRRPTRSASARSSPTRGMDAAEGRRSRSPALGADGIARADHHAARARGARSRATSRRSFVRDFTLRPEQLDDPPRRDRPLALRRRRRARRHARRRPASASPHRGSSAAASYGRTLHRARHATCCMLAARGVHVAGGQRSTRARPRRRGADRRRR